MLKFIPMLVVLLLTTGCASMIRHSTSSSYPDSKLYPYCGVVYDGRIIMGGLSGESIADSGYEGTFEQIFNSTLFVILGFIDTPLSFCLDTVLLPYDIYNVSTSPSKEEN